MGGLEKYTVQVSTNSLGYYGSNRENPLIKLFCSGSRDAPDTPILQDILQDISICSTIRYPAGYLLLSGRIPDSGYLDLLQQHRVRVLTTWVRCP